MADGARKSLLQQALELQDGPQAEMTVGEPEVIKSDNRAWYEKLADALQGPGTPGAMLTDAALSKSGQAIGGGLNRGFTFGLDKAVPGSGALATELDQSAREAAPPLYKAADTAATLMQPLPKPLAGEGFAASVGNTAAQTGAQSAARTYGDTEDLGAAARAGGWGTVFGAGASAGLGGAARAIGAGMGAASNAARRLAVGGTAGQYGDVVKDMGTREGIDFLSRDLGRIPEQQGLTNIVIPQSRAGYAVRAADRAQNVVGPQVGASLDRAAGEIPQGAISPANVELPIAQRAMELEAKQRPGAAEGFQALNQAAVAPMRTPRDLHTLKTEYEAEAYAPGAVGGSKEDLYSQGQAHAADVTRRELRRVMGLASEDANATFTKASSDFADTKLIENMAGKRAVQDFAAPLAGGALGAAGGYWLGKDPWDSVKYGALGAAAGRYGTDAVANATRLAEAAAGGMASATPGLVRIGAMQLDLKHATDPAEEYERQRREGGGL